MTSPVDPVGAFCKDGGREWYRIDDFDALDPFLVNLVTPSDQWIMRRVRNVGNTSNGSGGNVSLKLALVASVPR